VFEQWNSIHTQKVDKLDAHQMENKMNDVDSIQFTGRMKFVPFLSTVSGPSLDEM
jgi:hypothetical protein